MVFSLTAKAKIRQDSTWEPPGAILCPPATLKDRACLDIRPAAGCGDESGFFLPLKTKKAADSYFIGCLVNTLWFR